MQFSENLLGKLKNAKSICVLTGAGVSAESGVPTFRTKGGLWTRYRPEELASEHGFLKNPKLVWAWYECRRRIVNDVKPNPAHLALAKLEKTVNEFTLVTQNVDNLHSRAGSRNILEIHGNIMRNFCLKCVRDAKDEDLPKPKTTQKHLSFDDLLDEKNLQCIEVPKCVSCGGYIRPGVVWFGEALPHDVFERAHAATKKADFFMSIGTAGAVYPAAGLPALAHDNGAFVIEINPEPTEISQIMDETLLGKAGEVLPELLMAARGIVA